MSWVRKYFFKRKIFFNKGQFFCDCTFKVLNLEARRKLRQHTFWLKNGLKLSKSQETNVNQNGTEMFLFKIKKRVR